MTSRQTALAGAAFAPAFVAGLLLVNNPGGDASAARFAAFYGDAGNRARLIVAAALLCVAALAWLVFVTGLRERLAAGAASRLAAAAGTASATLICVCGALLAAVPAAISFGGAPVPSADLERVVPLAGYITLGLFAMPAAALTLATIGIGTLRERTLPRPLAWAAIAVAILLLGSLEFFPMAALILWVAATVITLARRPLRIPLPATP